MEVERVSAVALNMLVSTSFPAELLVIYQIESSSISGATTEESPVLAPEELGPPTGGHLLSQAQEGREWQGKKETLHCASTWTKVFLRSQGGFHSYPKSRAARKGICGGEMIPWLCFALPHPSSGPP